MNTLETKEGTGTESGTEKTAKITITLQAESKLDEMVKRVNNGFSGGRVTRQDLTSWILAYFSKYKIEDSIESIRQDHFDRVAYLESVLKQAKEARRNGETALDYASLLAPVTSASIDRPARGRRRAAKASGNTP